jgi:hypothetical protein
MNAPPSPPALPAGALQAHLYAFAIDELVRRHRASFQPLWSAESWAKLLIWLALNCGCSGEREALEEFAAGLDPALTSRMRRLFFARELEDLNLRLLADPAEREALILPLQSQAGAPDPQRVEEALSQAALSDLLAPPERWRWHEALVAVPWRTRPLPPLGHSDM